VLILGLSVFTGFTWLIGLSTSFAEAFLFRLVSGFGEGLFWPVAMAAVATFYENRKGLALGLFYVGFDVGSVAGLSIGGITYYLTNTWRTAFFVAPTIGLVAIIGSAFLWNRFEWFGGNRSVKIKIGRDALDLLENRQVIFLMIFAFLATWASVWQVVFLPFYYSKVMHFTVLYASLLASAVAIAGALGKITLGGLSDYWNRNRMIIGISFVLICAYLVFFGTSNVYIAFAGSIAMGFSSAAIFPILQSLIADSSEGRYGTALGLSTTSQSVATVIGPLISASLFYLGVGRALAITAMIPAVLTLALALVLREPRGNSANNQGGVGSQIASLDS
jgi:predicted MFS family arabinose efflux permease